MRQRRAVPLGPHVSAAVIPRADLRLSTRSAGEASTYRRTPRAAAGAGMVERGWLDADGRLTARGTAEHDAVEAATDAAAEQPWQAIGPAATARLRDLLDPIATTIRTTGLIPHPNPLGMPWPTS